LKKITMYACGDTFADALNSSDPFEKIKYEWVDKDLLFINLETTLCENKLGFFEKANLVNTPEKNVDYLRQAGVDIVNLAHNHIMDYGMEGLQNTCRVLKEANIDFIGIVRRDSKEKYKVKDVNGVKIGFLAYGNEGLDDNELRIDRVNESIIINDLEQIKKLADIVVISLHWGTEHVNYPSPKQQKLARKLIEHGANIILGHHPHVLQGIENYKNGVIFYSLGNFNFADYHASDILMRRYSVLVKISLSKNGINDFQLYPVKINEEYQPEILIGDKREDAINFITHISNDLINGKLNNCFWYKKAGKLYLVDNMRGFVKRIKKYGVYHFLAMCKWLIKPFTICCLFGTILEFLMPDKKYNQVKNNLETFKETK
jgi:hypothetical protein